MGFLEDALGDGAQTPAPIPLGRILNYAIGNATNPLPTSPNDIQQIFGHAQQFFSGLGGDLGSLNSLLDKAIKSALKDVTDVNGSFDDLYRGFVQLVAKAFAEALEPVANGVTGAVNQLDGTNIGPALSALAKSITNLVKNFPTEASTTFAKAYQDIVAFLQSFFDAVVKLLVSALADFNNLPGPLKCGPTDALNVVQQSVKLLLQINPTAQLNIEARLDAVGDSIRQLLTLAIGSATGKDQFIFGELIDNLFDKQQGILLNIIRGIKPEDLWSTFLQEIIFPTAIFDGLFKAVANNSLWSWLNLPCGFHPGDLNNWLNNPQTFSGDVALEREFRIELVARLDAFVRAEFGSGDLSTGLTEIDVTDTPYMVAGLISVILGTAIEFVFDAECAPDLDADLDGIEDLGFSLATSLAGQIRVVIRGLVSVLLRGASVYSVRNEVLIELIGTLFSSIFAAAIKGIVRNLTWTFQLVSAYPNANVGTAVVVVQIPSLEVVAGTTNQLQYLVLIRTPPGGQPPSISWTGLDQVKGIFADLAAYIDVGYRRFPSENRFPNIANPDNVTIIDWSASGGRLVVTATTDASGNLPQPVLRIYYCCEVAVMQPGSDPTQSYYLDIPVSPQMRIRGVTVLSNRGGVAKSIAVSA